ncbi:MAG: hypothetical protein ACOCP8_05690 [archaeon]
MLKNALIYIDTIINNIDIVNKKMYDIVILAQNSQQQQSLKRRFVDMIENTNYIIKKNTVDKIKIEYKTKVLKTNINIYFENYHKYKDKKGLSSYCKTFVDHLVEENIINNNIRKTKLELQNIMN